MDHKAIDITPSMIKAMSAAPLPNFNAMWQRYIRSDFRRQWLKSWAGDDIEKQRAAQALLDESTPM